MQIHITTSQRPRDLEAISLEEYEKRRLMRRRRVAKRMHKRFPMFAVQLMQAEFPGYTWEQHVEDISRKKRKYKSFRRPKPKGFDWGRIREEIPSFFYACRERRRMKAVVWMRYKNHHFKATIHRTWWGDYGDNSITDGQLIELWKGPLRVFINHPAVSVEDQILEI